jgi:hypothetical protein
MTPVQRQSRADGRHLAAGAFVNLCCLLALVFFAWLREQPLFWTNAGNWPIWLRELVGASFVPLLLFEFVLLVTFSLASLRNRDTGCPRTIAVALVVPILWALFILVLVICGANNVHNLMEGQPLHWHPR